MQEYCLSRDDLDFVLSVTKFKGKEAWKEDPMASVETQTKAAFTRTFNKAEHRARCNLAVDDFKKKKGKGKSAAEVPDDTLGELAGQFVALALWLSGQHTQPTLLRSAGICRGVVQPTACEHLRTMLGCYRA